MDSGHNGFVVPRGTDGAEIAAIVRAVYARPDDLTQLGEALRATVLDRFSVKPSSVDRYLALVD
jgi:hypothetical protein